MITETDICFPPLAEALAMSETARRELVKLGLEVLASRNEAFQSARLLDAEAPLDAEAVELEAYIDSILNSFPAPAPEAAGGQAKIGMPSASGTVEQELRVLWPQLRASEKPGFLDHNGELAGLRERAFALLDSLFGGAK